MRTVDADPHSQNDSQSRSRACAIDRRCASVAHFLAKTASLSSSVHHARAIVAPCSIDPRDGATARCAILVRDVVVPAPSGSRPASPVAVTVPVTVVSGAGADADRARHQGLPVSARCPVSLHHSFIRETSGSGTLTVHSPRLGTHQPFRASVLDACMLAAMAIPAGAMVPRRTRPATTHEFAHPSFC
jgi:hypothetical protein